MQVISTKHRRFAGLPCWIRGYPCAILKKQILQNRIHRNFHPPPVAVLSAASCPIANRLRICRSYSMPITRFWYKPLAPLRCRIFALPELTHRAVFSRTLLVVRQYLCRTSRTGRVSKIKRVRTLQARTLRLCGRPLGAGGRPGGLGFFPRCRGLPLPQTNRLGDGRRRHPRPVREAVPRTRPIFRSSTYDR